MIIDAQVHDFTAYLPLHPADPAAMLKYCGKDGSEGLPHQDRGRAHSSHARSMMANYLLGPLQPDRCAHHDHDGHGHDHDRHSHAPPTTVASSSSRSR